MSSLLMYYFNYLNNMSYLSVQSIAIEFPFQIKVISLGHPDYKVLEIDIDWYRASKCILHF